MRPEGSGRWRYATPVAALAVVIAAAAGAILVHALLGLLELKLAVAETSGEDRQAATALIGLFAADHPRVRIRTVLTPDRQSTAAALDGGEAQLALVRADAAPQDGQTLVITRRDAAVFVVPGGSHVDNVAKLRGETVALLDGRKLDARLLDLILTHYGVPPGSVRREVLTVDQLTDAARHHRIGAVFVVAPVAGKLWLPLYTALRKGSGAPRTLEVDEAAAIAREHPILSTIDLPKGAFVGSVPAPSDDITTLSVSHRLVARSGMPDWLAGEITREVLTGKPKLVALDDDLAGLEAPDTDDKVQALPIHPGAAAYLSGNLPSMSDQAQSLAYWLGLMASAIASLTATGLALHHRYRARQPPARVTRLLEIWLAVRAAEPAALDRLGAEADRIVEAVVREGTRRRTEGAEMWLVALLATHVHAAIRHRAGHPSVAGDGPGP
jgi:TRAP-type uncharacterized transport system substrate-binding protein